MFIVRRLLTYINPLFLIVGIEVIRGHHNWWWIFLLGSVLLLCLTVWDFSKRELGKRFWFFLLTPLIFLLGSYAFIFFLESLILLRVVCLISAGLLFLTIEQTLNYFYFTTRYQPYTLENLSLYTNVISIFYLTSALLSSIIFLRLPLLIAMVVLYGISFLLLFQVHWSHKIDWGKAKLFGVIISLILVELFVCLTYLPLSFYVSALLISVIFYLLVGLSRLFLLGNLTKKNIITHIVITGLISILILITAQWS